MKASELRIGNYITRFGDNVVVDGIDKKHRNDTDYYIRIKEDRELGYWLDQFKPIVLTEEILMNNRFTRCSIYPNNFSIKGMRLWRCNDMFICDKNGVEVMYLHRLQNLYFSLTNNELDIQL